MCIEGKIREILKEHKVEVWSGTIQGLIIEISDIHKAKLKKEWEAWSWHCGNRDGTTCLQRDNCGKLCNHKECPVRRKK